MNVREPECDRGCSNDRINSARQGASIVCDDALEKAPQVFSPRADVIRDWFSGLPIMHSDEPALFSQPILTRIIHEA